MGRAKEILERIKGLEGVKTDVDLATALKTASTTLSTWKKRGQVSYEKIIEYGREHGVSLEYLVNGKGPVRITDMVQEPGGIYEVTTNQDEVYRIAALVVDRLQQRERQLPYDKIENIIKLLHRDALGSGSQVPEQRIDEVIKLAT